MNTISWIDGCCVAVTAYIFSAGLTIEKDTGFSISYITFGNAVKQFLSFVAPKLLRVLNYEISRLSLYIFYLQNTTMPFFFIDIYSNNLELFSRLRPYLTCCLWHSLPVAPGSCRTFEMWEWTVVLILGDCLLFPSWVTVTGWSLDDILLPAAVTKYLKANIEDRLWESSWHEWRITIVPDRTPVTLIIQLCATVVALGGSFKQTRCR